MVDEVESVIKDLATEGMTCVIVTHEMSFARNVATKVVFLAEKGIYEQGSAHEIFDNPSKPLTQRFLYRSRLYEKELLANELDLLSLNTELRKFVSRYDTNQHQTSLLTSVCDELLYPVFNNEKEPASSANLRLLCSESSEHHLMRIEFSNVRHDPLSEFYMDKLNYTLLDHYAQVLLSKQKDDSWEVTIQM